MTAPVDESLVHAVGMMNQRHPLRPCAVCGGETWSAVGHTSLPITPRPAQVGLPRNVVPLLVVSCSACGHTLFFNEIVLGVAAAVSAT